MNRDNTCLSCKSLSGEKRISPGPVVYEGEYWVVECTYPTALKGWVVIVLKRHVEALNVLTEAEFREYGLILFKVVQGLKHLLDYQKEYVIEFGEAEGFNHVHFHVVPKPYDLPESLRSGKIFALLHPEPEDLISREEIRQFCEELRGTMW